MSQQPALRFVRFSPRRAFAIVLSLGMMATASAQAQLTWNNAGPSDIWSTSAGNENWLPGNVVWTNGSSAIFGGVGETISLSTGITADDITFNSTGYLIQSDTLTLVTSPIIKVTTTGHAATISSTIAGTLGLHKTGDGTLLLNGSAVNSFTGGLILLR